MHEALLDTHTKKQMFFRFFNASRSVEIVTLKKEAFQSKATRPLSDNLRFIVKKIEHISGGMGDCLGSTSINMSDVGEDF